MRTMHVRMHEIFVQARKSVSVCMTTHKHDMQAFVLGKIGKTLAINFERISLYEGKIVPVEADPKDA